MYVTISERHPLNHQHIERALLEAGAGLEALLAGWRLGPTSHYQLANRFAWSWKLASLGVPVVLVYLGFLQADEMRDQGRAFKTALDWEAVVKSHGERIVPSSAWGSTLDIGGTPFTALCRSVRVDLPSIQVG